MRNLPMYVWFDNEEVDVPVFMGTLTASFVRGHEVFSFDTDWLKYKQFRNFFTATLGVSYAIVKW